MIYNRYLHWACFAKDLDTIKFLVEEKDADLYSVHFDHFEAKMPLLVAILTENLEVIKYVIDRPVPPRIDLIHDHQRNTPLHIAFRTGSKDVVMLLKDKINNGVDGEKFGKPDKLNRRGLRGVDMPHNIPYGLDDSREADYLIVIDKARKNIVEKLIELTNQKYKNQFGNKTSLESNEAMEYKIFDYSKKPDKQSILIIYFSDELLDYYADELELKVSLQDKYANLPFEMACPDMYERYTASQLLLLYKEILEEEAIDLIHGLATNLYLDHFMLHNSEKLAIPKAMRKHGWKLVFSLYSTQWFNNLKPINLIANYYGEKYALQFLFLVHHIAWLLVPSVLGTILFAYQVYLGIVTKTEDEDYLTAHLRASDSAWNYAYVVFMFLWSSIYFESWKRKENSLNFLWALNDRNEARIPRK